jgi:hypothetical protein
VSLPASVLGRIDEACDRFEDAWQAGHRPRLVDFLEAAEGPERQARLRRLLVVELSYRRGRGEAPSKEEYRRSFPDALQAIDDAITAAASSVREVDGLTHTAPHEVGQAESHANGATASPAASSAEPEVPERAGRYLVEGEIARGGMGIVLRAHDPDLKRPLAVKVLQACYRGDPGLTHRFVEEAQITGQLQHPGVPPVHEVGLLPDGRPFMALKLIDGAALDVLLARRPSLRHDPAHWLAVFGSVCQAVAYAHSRGVIHRDLKPGNIMVGAFGEVQVMDWGLAKVLSGGRQALGPGAAPPDVPPGADAPGSPHATEPGAVVGTPGYTAPEQARGEPADERADVFGLGAILCVVLTGRPPFLGEDRLGVLLQAAAGDLTEAFARIQASGADAALTQLARACLAPDKEERPRDAGVVAQAWADYQAGVQERLRRAELERAQAQVKAAQESKRRRLALGLAACSVLLVVVGWLAMVFLPMIGLGAGAVVGALAGVIGLLLVLVGGGPTTWDHD